MACEEELNALRQAEQALARFRSEHSSTADSPLPVPTADPAKSAPVSAEVLHRLAELKSAVTEKRSAYSRCLGEADTLINSGYGAGPTPPTPP